jgi:hypothetical protein
VTLAARIRGLEQGAKPKTIHFDFFAKPVRIEGEGRVERLVVEPRGSTRRTRRSARASLHDPLRPGGELHRLQDAADRGRALRGGSGRFANDEGRIGEGLYCVGWARRGPSGTIGTNRPDGYAIADTDRRRSRCGAERQGGRAGLDRLLEGRGVEIVTFRDWQKIEAAEAARARDGSPREKFTAISDMLAQLGIKPPN